MSLAGCGQLPSALAATWADDLLEAAYAAEQRGQAARAARLLDLRAQVLPATTQPPAQRSLSPSPAIPLSA